MTQTIRTLPLTLILMTLTVTPAWAGEGLKALEFLAGEWDMKGATLPEALGEQAGPHQGVTVCAFGGSGTWMACDFETAELGALGHYAVHVVIWQRRGSERFEAFMVNSYGSATYHGFVDGPGRVVFFGGTPGGEQRITYEALEGGRVRFHNEKTVDGARTFVPHTEAIWTARAGR